MSKVFYDTTAHNYAVIETVEMRPYYGAKKRTVYRLTQMDNETTIYHVSCHETEADAKEKMETQGFNWINMGTYNDHGYIRIK